jgi:3-hydroxymyristoyl/3-hydroxydecanoyl-(acyl carrier protein) dehydratase
MDMTFTISSTHPSLEGHFPGNPVVPGVVILDEVINIIKSIKPGFTITAIPTVKFIQPLLAEQTVNVEVNEKNETAISFSCSHNDKKLVAGQLTLKSLT